MSAVKDKSYDKEKSSLHVIEDLDLRKLVLEKLIESSAGSVKNNEKNFVQLQVDRKNILKYLLLPSKWTILMFYFEWILQDVVQTIECVWEPFMDEKKKRKRSKKSVLITKLCLNPHKELIKFVYYISFLFFFTFAILFLHLLPFALLPFSNISLQFLLYLKLAIFIN